MSTEQEVFAATVTDVTDPDNVLLPGHDVPLGRYTTVRRLLPARQHRMIGAWCFVDHFGPDDVTGRPGMQVPPHPHIGLQTVTWLVEGIIEHRDSLGSHQLIGPGQLNLMTAGNGIAHSEYTPPEHPASMHGLQLWIALPDDVRHDPARFEHHPQLPVVRRGDATITVIAGEFAGTRSPARVHTPLFGAQVTIDGAGTHHLPVDTGYEHGVVVMAGTATVDGTALAPGALLYLGPHRDELVIEVTGPATLFLLGGEPFEEPLVMWWNFVGGSHDEILAARDDWMAGRRFAHVAGCTADPIPAPPMPAGRLKPRHRHGTT